MTNYIKTALACALLMMSSVSTIADDKLSADLDAAGYTVLVTLKTKEGQAERFKEEMKKNVEGSRKEPGVIVYRSYQDPKDKNMFYNYEAYVNEDAFKAHLETPHVKAILPLLEEMLDGPVKIQQITRY